MCRSILMLKDPSHNLRGIFISKFKGVSETNTSCRTWVQYFNKVKVRHRLFKYKILKVILL